LTILTLTTATPMDDLYHEPLRPQFHFSAAKNWLNDPNGLVYYQGEYHLFYQYNPFGTEWGNMHWGHAVSKDLVRWQELPIAIQPDPHGDVWSGSIVVDWENTAGLQQGEEKTLLAFYTAATAPGKPFTQCLAYSNDRGRTWFKYAKNPIVGHIVAENRDPKVVWHGPSQQWIMVLYLTEDEFALLGSQNFTEWKELSRLRMPGVIECPDFFELPVDGNKRNSKWVFVGGDGSYFVGSFDGKTFRPEGPKQPGDYGANFYATQSYSDIPAADGRRIQIAWMRGGKYPGMPFNQQMSFPCELTLRKTPEGIRLFRLPVREISALYPLERPARSLPETLHSEERPHTLATGDLWDIRLELEPGSAQAVALRVNGQEVRYDAAKSMVTAVDRSAPLAPVEGRIKLRILADRTSLEVYGNDGAVSLSSCFVPTGSRLPVQISCEGGAVRVVDLQVVPLRSAWR
jgi:fructan beta-fructosidase